MTSPTTIYIVTAGDYSAYTIHAVFSTKALAEDYLTKCPRLDGQIEEYTLDECAEYDLRTIYYANITLATGEITESGESRQEFCAPNYTDLWRYLHIQPCIARAESAKSVEHAIKLAVEIRQAHLRERGFEQS